MAKQGRRKNNPPKTAIKVKRVRPKATGSVPRGVRSNKVIEELRRAPLPFPSSDESEAVERLLSKPPHSAATTSTLPAIVNVPVPELDWLFSIRLLGQKDRDALEREILSPNDWTWFTFTRFFHHLVALSAVDEHGELMFADTAHDDLPMLTRDNAPQILPLAHAVLSANDMYPPQLKGDPLEGLSDSQIDDTVEYMLNGRLDHEGVAVMKFWLRLNKYKPIRYADHYREQHLQGSEERELTIAALPKVPEARKGSALNKLLEKHPRPIHYKFWNLVREEIMGGLSKDAIAHGVPVEVEEKLRLRGSIAAAASKAREEALSSKDGLVEIFKKKYRKEAETDFHIRRKSREVAPRRIKVGDLEDDDELEAPDIPNEEIDWDLVEDGTIERLDLERRFLQLPEEDQKTIRILWKHKGDYPATSKELKISEQALRQRLSRIRRKAKDPLR